MYKRINIFLYAYEHNICAFRATAVYSRTCYKNKWLFFSPRHQLYFTPRAINACKKLKRIRDNQRRAHERRFNHRPPSVIDSEQQSYVRVAFLSRETRDSPIRRRSVRYTVIGYDLRGAFRNPRRRVNKQELAVICSSRLSARPSDPKAKTLPVILFRAARINTATETLQLYLRRDRNRDSPHAFEGKLSCARTAPRSDIIYVYIYMIGNQLPTG